MFQHCGLRLSTVRAHSRRMKLLLSCAALLCALLGLAAAQSTSIASPEDYPYTRRVPAGCTSGAGDCSYFVGIQRNEGDATYLDFHLEGQAAGWVAIGFSTTPTMPNSDVLACLVVGSSVGVVDTWNPDFTNELDSSQVGLVSHSATMNNGQIVCDFSRQSAAGPDNDLDLLATPYRHMYGLGLNAFPAPGSLVQSLNTHRPQNFPDVSAEIDLVAILDGAEIATPAPIPAAMAPSAAPQDYTMIARSPSGCEPSSCDRFFGVQVNADNDSYLDFYMEGSARGWLALGFTLTPNMLDADVVGCNVVGDNNMVVATDTTNPRSRINVGDPFQDGITRHASSFVNGRISCSFSRFAAGVALNGDFDLGAQPYYIIFGAGQDAASSASSGFSPHDNNRAGIPRISQRRIDFNPARIMPTIAVPSPSGGNIGAIAGGASAAIVVVLIAAGVPVLVWLVCRHRKVTISLQKGNMPNDSGNESHDPRNSISPVAYQVTSKLVEEGCIQSPGPPSPEP